MSFRILGLDPAPFAPLYGQSEAGLARVGEVPEALRARTLSVRAFDREAMMLDAALVGGADLEATIARLFTLPAAAFLQVHFATRGCYAARVERVG